MANTTPIIHKRTFVSGRLPSTDPANTRYIRPGELSINLTDKKAFSSNGSVLFEIGSNLQTLSVTSLIANGSTGNADQVLISNGSSVYWSNNVGYTGSQGVMGYTGSRGVTGGSNSQVLFHDDGSSNGSSNFTFTKATSALNITGPISTGNTTITGFTRLSSPNTSAAAWTTAGINLIQSAATFTDTTSSGTVADIRMNNFAAQTLAASSATTASLLYGTYFNNPLAGTNVTATERWAIGADSLRVTSGVLLDGITSNQIQIASAMTSGLLRIGGPSGTGTITFGQSTLSQTTNIQAAATASGNTKTINIGTGGASGSTTTITIGAGAGTSNVAVNGALSVSNRIAQIGNINSPSGYISFTGTFNIAANTQHNMFGMQSVIVPGQPGTLNSLYGLLFLPTIQSSANNISSINPIFARVDSADTYTGTVDSIFMIQASTPSWSSPTPITNVYQFTAQNATATTNVRGFWSLITAGANKWNFYASGSANNYMAGGLGIGTTTLNAALTVSGAANVSTSVNTALLTVGTDFIANTLGITTTGSANVVGAATFGNNITVSGNSTFNGRVTLAPIGVSAPAWTTNGIALVQSAATFTDTTSSGTVADIRINNFDAQTLAAASSVTATILFGTYFNAPIAGTNVTATNRFALGAETLRVTSTSSFGDTLFGPGISMSGGVIFNTITSNITIGTSQTTGLLTFGGTSGTAAITLGQSTVSQTTNIQAGATASGNTKTINIGTGAASGSTTAITLGSATLGATQTTTINGRVTLAPIGVSAPAWTTNGIALVQSAATFTDTTSTGAITDVYINRFGAQTFDASNVITTPRLFNTYFVNPTPGANVTPSNIYALGTDSIRVDGVVFMAGSTFAGTSISAATTTGATTIGGPSQTGTMTIGQSTVSQTTNIQAAATASGSTKTINIGTGGTSGSTTAIAIGSATLGATQTTTVNGRVTFAPIGASAAAWTTSGINLIQAAATFTDTTSTGTVAEIRINNFASQTLAATSTTTVTNLYGTYFVSPTAGANVTATGAYAIGADSIRIPGGVQFDGVGGNFVTLGGSTTTGQTVLGGSSQTGTMIIGRSTLNQITNIQTAATASGNTKTINLGTGGLSGSTTTITIGSTFGTSIVLNAPIRMAAYTVATLPAAGTAGRRAYITDATAPTFLSTLTGGGAVVCPVFDNGTAWVAG